jgi:hypothetical protein
MNEDFRLSSQFSSNPSICNFMQLLAFKTWMRIKFVRNRNGLKIHEPTLTQDILFEFTQYSEFYNQSRIKIFEAINEPLNGNDIELVIQTENGFLLAPIQAKILYNTNDYPAMEHGNQINDLISYANRVGGVPLYLLYNYYNDETFTYSGNRCGVPFNKTQFGISLISAHYLRGAYAFRRIDRNGNRKWNIPSFTDLHPNFAIPWFVLGCCIYSKTTSTNVTNLLNNPRNTGFFQDNVRTYSLDQLISKDLWKPFSIENDNSNSSNDIQIDNEDYSPKYRVVIYSSDEKHE